MISSTSIYSDYVVPGVIFLWKPSFCWVFIVEFEIIITFKIALIYHE